MWKVIYPELLGQEMGFEILHATELLAEWIAEARIPMGELPLAVTYHDPCDLGRKSGVYDAPRRVLQNVPGLSLLEMSGSGQISECCGGGGNLASFDPDVVSDVALRRIGRACEVEAQALISACQQCERTLMDAVRRHPEARRARMRVMDLTELICRAMDKAGDAGQRPREQR
jgi:Fe-S oxidoreductase